MADAKDTKLVQTDQVASPLTPAAQEDYFLEKRQELVPLDPDSHGTNNPNKSPLENTNPPRSRLQSFLGRLKSPTCILGLLWLAPALTLLILNAKEHIIGAGLGCHGDRCIINPYSKTAVLQAQKLDKQNHDILGALQIVAKLLEMWFTFLVGNLVYNLALRFAEKDVVDINLLTMYAEFLDLRYLKDLWKSFWRVRAHNKAGTGKKAPVTLYFFVVFVALLCIIANVMGPTAAILVLPTLQLVDINQQENVVFDKVLSASPPADFAPVCNSTTLDAGHYSCAAPLNTYALDELQASAAATSNQRFYRNALILPPVLQESNLSFSLNVSENAPVIFAPNRQLLREFATDLLNFYNATSGPAPDIPSYGQSALFNHSLQTLLQRQGPTIGETTNCYPNKAYSAMASGGRPVRCFVTGTTAKCIRLGGGWKDNNIVASAKFTIHDIEDSANITASIWTTNKAAYIDLSQCNVAANATCDWDAIFAAEPPPTLGNMFTGNQQTFQYDILGSDVPVWCSSNAFLSFATYSLNPSPVSNIISLVNLGVTTDHPSTLNNSAAVFVHPTWNLLTWAVDQDSVVAGARDAASLFVAAVKGYLLKPETGGRSMNLVQHYLQVQTYSLLPYTTLVIDDAKARNARIKASPSAAVLLKSWATVQVWKFGLDSRTAKIGFTVLTICCLCVVGGLVAYASESKPLTEMLAEALMHDKPNPDQAAPPTPMSPVGVQKQGTDGIRVRYNRQSSQLSYEVTSP